MQHRAAAPFFLKRSKDEMSGVGYTSTKETIHGLVRLDGDQVTVQWRLARHTERMGALTMDSDDELEAVREVALPLAGIAGAVVRRSRWWPLSAPVLVVRAADLAAFEEVAGAGGLRLGHPAELVLRLRRRDVLVAEELAAELELALAERALAGAAESPASLSEGAKQPQVRDAGPGADEE
jgi:hypothetical protein